MMSTITVQTATHLSRTATIKPPQGQPHLVSSDASVPSNREDAIGWNSRFRAYPRKLGGLALF
jgi:hypothetical protein